MPNYIKELPKDAKQIKGTLNWATPNGKIYGIETRMLSGKTHKHFGEYFQYSLIVNRHNGYVYCPIKYIIDQNKTEVRQKRVHIIIAKTFIPNPFNLPIVGHKNNIKTDNRIENLYWTTYKENTQKAVDDGLMVNKKGYDDSQSYPVVMFNTYTNEEIARYGSCCEAHKHNHNISTSTIIRQCKYKKPVRKPFYFRFQNDESVTPPPIVVQYDYNTDKEIGRYWNTQDAFRKTGIPSKTISKQCCNKCKPKNKTKSGTYFQYLRQ